MPTLPSQAEQSSVAQDTTFKRQLEMRCLKFKVKQQERKFLRKVESKLTSSKQQSRLFKQSVCSKTDFKPYQANQLNSTHTKSVASPPKDLSHRSFKDKMQSVPNLDLDSIH